MPSFTPIERCKIAIFDAALKGFTFKITPGSCNRCYLMATFPFDLWAKGDGTEAIHNTPIAILNLCHLTYQKISTEDAFLLVEQVLYCPLVDQDGKHQG